MSTRSRKFYWIYMGLFAVPAMTASAQPYAYVANLGNNTVAVMNMATATSSGSVSVASGPAGAAVTPDGGTVYISSTNANVVSVINASTKAVVGTIAVGSNPKQLAVSPNGALVYVIDAVSNMVSVISTSSNTVTASIAVGSRPSAVAFSPDSSRAYVTNLWSNNVSVISTSSNSVTATFNTGAAPNGVAVTPDGQHIYVTNQGSNAVTVHDSAGNVLTTISGFATPVALAITPNGTRAFVVNANGNSVSVVDTSSNTVITKTTVGSMPTSVAISTDGTQAYVANEYGYSLSVLDTTNYSVVKTIPNVGIWPAVVATQPAPMQSATCTFNVSAPGSLTIGSGGGTLTFNVATTAGCSWSASGPGWPGSSITPGGSGSGPVTFSAGPNSNSGALSGSVTIAGQSFTVSEAGIACTYSLSGTSSLGSGGGPGSISVTAPAGCAWSVTAYPSWVTINSTSTSSGSGTVSFTAAPNSGTGSRSGSFTVAGQSFNLTEAGLSFTGVRVNCGGAAFTDANGNAWQADLGRNTSSTTASITGADIQAIYQKEAYSGSGLTYTLAVPPGTYTVKLRFAETYLALAGQRSMNVWINSALLLSNFDILANTSGNTAYDKYFTGISSNGTITIQVVPNWGSIAKLSGIEIY